MITSEPRKVCQNYGCEAREPYHGAFKSFDNLYFCDLHYITKVSPEPEVCDFGLVAAQAGLTPAERGNCPTCGAIGIVYGYAVRNRLVIDSWNGTIWYLIDDQMWECGSCCRSHKPEGKQA